MAWGFSRNEASGFRRQAPSSNPQRQSRQAGTPGRWRLRDFLHAAQKRFAPRLAVRRLGLPARGNRCDRGNRRRDEVQYRHRPGAGRQAREISGAVKKQKGLARRAPQASGKLLDIPRFAWTLQGGGALSQPVCRPEGHITGFGSEIGRLADSNATTLFATISRAVAPPHITPASGFPARAGPPAAPGRAPATPARASGRRSRRSRAPWKPIRLRTQPSMEMSAMP